MNFVSGIIDRLFAIAGALLFLQAPLFMLEYQQQLLGRVSELKLQIIQLQKAAGERSLDQYIAKFTASSDTDFSQHGLFLKTLVQRYQSLATASQALLESTAYTKPFTFIRVANVEMVQQTAEHYTFGLPLTLEACAYALLGLLFGMGIFKSLILLKRRILRFAP